MQSDCHRSSPDKVFEGFNVLPRTVEAVTRIKMITEPSTAKCIARMAWSDVSPVCRATSAINFKLASCAKCLGTAPRYPPSETLGITSIKLSEAKGHLYDDGSSKPKLDRASA